MLATSTSSGERVHEAGAEAVDEQFWAMVCADEQLLAAEFEAIVAADWPRAPTDTGGRGANRRPPGGPARGSVRAVIPAARPARPGVDGWGRQRSPPHAQ